MIPHFRILFAALLLLTLASQTATARAGGGSAVGNGGDTITAFLESTRRAMLETLKQIQREPGAACGAVAGPPSEAARSECDDLVLAAASQIPALHSHGRQVEFAIRSQPLEVEGPDGNPRPVAARTQLGPEGPIEFHLGSVQFLNPSQLIQLVSHEFLHKILFNGRYIEDNPPTAAYPNGRALLDAASQAISAHAERWRLIGTSLRLQDHFDCRIVFSGSGPSTGMRGSSPRRFSSKNEWNRFQLGIGHLPSDMEVYVLETLRSRIELRMLAHEENGCLPLSETATASRWTLLEIWRVPFEELPAASAHNRSSKLNELKLEGFHPACSPKQPFSIAWGQMEFSCRYIGSTADSE
jgi:hypothetical protein